MPARDSHTQSTATPPQGRSPLTSAQSSSVFPAASLRIRSLRQRGGKGKVMKSLHDHQTNAIQQHGLTVILDEKYKSPHPLCSCVGPSGTMSPISVPLAPSTQ